MGKSSDMLGLEFGDICFREHALNESRVVGTETARLQALELGPLVASYRHAWDEPDCPIAHLRNHFASLLSVILNIFQGSGVHRETLACCVTSKTNVRAINEDHGPVSLTGTQVDLIARTEWISHYQPMASAKRARISP